MADGKMVQKRRKGAVPAGGMSAYCVTHGLCDHEQLLSDSVPLLQVSSGVVSAATEKE